MNIETGINFILFYFHKLLYMYYFFLSLFLADFIPIALNSFCEPWNLSSASTETVKQKLNIFSVFHTNCSFCTIISQFSTTNTYLIITAHKKQVVDVQHFCRLHVAVKYRCHCLKDKKKKKKKNSKERKKKKNQIPFFFFSPFIYNAVPSIFFLLLSLSHHIHDIIADDLLH